MAKYRIAALPGDGTGPEVLVEGLKVLEAAAQKTGFTYDLETYDLGGDRYLRTGEALPDSVLEELRSFDAIYLAAIGHPDVPPGILERGILLKIRFEFDQYINLRPVKLYPNVYTPIKDKTEADIDFVVVRENCGGLYRGKGAAHDKGTHDEVATQEMIYSRGEVDRCLSYAFDYTKRRNKANTLMLCGKTNVLTHVYELWERAFHEMGDRRYRDIKREYAHVDAICMWMVKNPEWFDVIVTGNMFGDIITDLGAMVQGGMGLAAGANINPKGTSMFEPIGGSAPKYTGQGIINPIACIAAGQMMLDHLGEEVAAELVEDAMMKFLASGKLKGMSPAEIEASGFSTAKIGDAIAEIVASG